MNTTLNRLNAVSAMATSTLLVLLCLVALLTHPAARAPSGTLAVHTLAVDKARAVWHADRRTQDFLQVHFDADVDLRPLFGRNTKQVFVSLAVEYSSRRHPNNSIVLWDRIVRRKADAHVVLQDARNKYPVREVARSFENIADATFVLKWNVMPYVGLLAYGDDASSGRIVLPRRSEVEKGAKVYY